MKSLRNISIRLILPYLAFFILPVAGSDTVVASGPSSFKQAPSIAVEYEQQENGATKVFELPLASTEITASTRISTYMNDTYRAVIHEIHRPAYTEINGELIHLKAGNSCATLRIIFPLESRTWKWHHGLDKTEMMKDGMLYTDTVSIRTTIPPDGAFNAEVLRQGGYGDPVGKGSMSYYPLAAISSDVKGYCIGVDMSAPVVYRLAGKNDEGLIAEFDLATSPLTVKFPDRSFFRLVRFDFEPEWGMRKALEQYYAIYEEEFRKRVITEGIWLPFTPLRSIPGWSDFGFAFHETSWGSNDIKDGKKIPNILSDRETGVVSFQYTEPWDVQLPISTKTIAYDTLVSDKSVPAKHREYLRTSATHDKNGRWQARRLNTPWFRTGWAASITTNCDPEIQGFNRYQFVLKEEIDPARKMNVDGIYFDSMEWNWHHDLNYREEHFAYTDYPLTFSESVGKPAIWNFSSEFEFIKKIADEMHLQGKLAMGNGHGWNPFAASNLDLFGAELSWYSSHDHDVDALDFKRAISFRKPIVFLLNEGLNDKAFTEPPYYGYEVYFEKMMAYGFFPSFFSVDASNDPYWQDKSKIENGRPFFKKYIPLIKEISAAGWEPVTMAGSGSAGIRIERFGKGDRIFFTVRNNSAGNVECTVKVDTGKLGITDKYTAREMTGGNTVEIKNGTFRLTIPAERTRVILITP
ncbi:MAG: hypothetical protein GYA41_08875 [Bacteroidales bacterium]|nr:hypothetical protein [Bacteroidales bacterium]